MFILFEISIFNLKFEIQTFIKYFYKSYNFYNSKYFKKIKKTTCEKPIIYLLHFLAFKLPPKNVSTYYVEIKSSKLS